MEKYPVMHYTDTLLCTTLPGMFIRWHKRQGKTDVHWGAVLVEAVRVDGKPRQRHVAYLGGFSERRIDSVDQRRRFWSQVKTRLHALADRLSDEDRNRIIGEIASRVLLSRSRAVPTAEHAQPSKLPCDDDLDREIFDLLRSIQPSDTKYWLRAVALFEEIKEHSGVERAKQLFNSFVAPSKKEQKALQDKLLRLSYQSLQEGPEKLTLDRAAELLHEMSRKDGRPVFGTSPDAIRKHLLRIQRDLNMAREWAAKRLHEEFRKAGRPETLEAIRESLPRAGAKLLAEGDPAAADLIRRWFLTYSRVPHFSS
jgi:hypothetical protein